MQAPLRLLQKGVEVQRVVLTLHWSRSRFICTKTELLGQLHPAKRILGAEQHLAAHESFIYIKMF